VYGYRKAAISGAYLRLLLKNYRGQSAGHEYKWKSLELRRSVLLLTKRGQGVATTRNTQHVMNSCHHYYAQRK